MRFLVDECTGSIVARWLRDQGHDVFSVFDEARGITDDVVLARACAEDRILITSDKDFGELVFREGLSHRGVVLLRLDHPAAANQIVALTRLLAGYADRLAGRFAVLTETRVRVSDA